MSSPPTPGANPEILWKQYTTHIDLYKFYLDISLKAIAFYYGITGAIVTYYFAHAGDGLVKYSLLLPIAMSLTLAGIFVYGARLLRVIRDEMFNIVNKLGLETGPEVMVLIVTLRAYAVVILLTALSLGALMILR